MNTNLNWKSSLFCDEQICSLDCSTEKVEKLLLTQKCCCYVCSCVSLFNALFIHFPSLEFLDFGNAPWANKSFMCTQDYSPLYLNSSHQKLILIFRYINFQVISSLRSRTRSVYWLSDIHKICRLFVPQHMTRTRLYIQKTKDDPSKKLRLNFAPPRMMKKNVVTNYHHEVIWFLTLPEKI